MNLPSRLYKYRAIDGFTERLIVQRELHFSSVKDFNDPFEAKPVFKTDLQSPEGKKWFKKLADLRGFKSPSKRFLLKRSYERLTGNQVQTTNQVGLKNLLDRDTGICCLAEEQASLLMWPHYADSHRGICIEFDTSIWPFNLAWQVQYSNEYPLIDNATNTPEDILSKCLLTKSTCWAYECEWRIIMRTLPATQLNQLADRKDAVAEAIRKERGPGNYIFPKEAITRIIFGLRADDKQRALVKSWIASAGLSIQFAEAKQGRDRFEIEISDV